MVRLWALGGLTEPAAEPGSTRAEVPIALAGIAASVVLGAALVLVARSLPRGHVHHALDIWGRVNLLIGVANAVPGHGLDANALVRTALQGSMGDAARASRATLRVGQVFGVLLAAAAFLPHATLDLVPPIIFAAVALLAAAGAGEALPSDAPGDRDPAGTPGEPSEPPETA
jgi:Zn-dependent protease